MRSFFYAMKGGGRHAIQTQASLFLSGMPAPYGREVLRGTPEDHHVALQQARARPGEQAQVWPRMEEDS